MRSFSLFLLLICFSFFGCRNTHSDKNGKIAPDAEPQGKMKYAEKFSITMVGDNHLLSVYSPWQNASETVFTYLVGHNKANVPDSLHNLAFIQSPVKNAIIMSTTFISFIDTLGELSSITGVSGGQNSYNEELRKRIQNGSVRDVGYDYNMNYEVIVELNPDVVFMFGVQSGIVQTINKLKEIGIPVVLCADYLEPYPLGRTEWLKFFSIFYDKQEQADSIFNQIEENYNSLAGLYSTMRKKPTVMLGLPWKDTWYVAGGSSYAARLIHDAGGEYIYRDLKNTEARPIDIEAVFLRGLEADFWINPGVATSLSGILEHDERFELFSSFQKSSIFSNSKRRSPGGGNDYWESGILHPDLVLQDLIRIFHDSSIHRSALHYYFRLD